jgi:uncharacterized protein (TIGR00290 family)
MNERKRILLSWSGGKDCAWALHLLRTQNEYEVVGLLTTINQQFNRVAMHGFREELLDMQAEAAGLPVWKVPLPWPCSNEHYEAAMATACARAVDEGLYGIAFGDLFLEDVRAYRIEKLASTGLVPIFPCWGLPTDELARTMIASGLRAHLTCVDPRQLDASFAGRNFDAQLLSDLPATADPCGERGEFHSFVSAGPMFSHGDHSRSIAVRVGETVERDGFCYVDLLPEIA